jgi:hypothetical protein
VGALLCIEKFTVARITVWTVSTHQEWTAEFTLGSGALNCHGTELSIPLREDVV